MNSREAALRSLIKCGDFKKYSNIEVDSVLNGNNIPDKTEKTYSLEKTPDSKRNESSDKALYTSLVYGVIERAVTLDYIIGYFSKIPVEKLDKNVLYLLRMGVYQIMFMDRIPAHAVCSETVELCKKYSNSGAAGFVNAILRETLRHKNAINYPDKKKEPEKYLSVYYGFPSELCAFFGEKFGCERSENLMRAFNRKPFCTLRVNTLKITRTEYLKMLPDAGIPAHESKLTVAGIVLERSVPVVALPGFDSGLCFVQDEASQLCVETLSPSAGETVFDVCSCPGGKAFSAAMCMNNDGEIIASDLHENKLTLVSHGAKRLGIDIISTVAADARQYNPEFERVADKIICDVPCSGLGVIAKKPDLRYKDMNSLGNLKETQLKILSNSSRYLKRGGTMIYSTCTINPDENESVVRAFLSDNDEFELVHNESGEIMRTLYPDTNIDNDSTDGFFFALLKRKK